jgi:hypothetical protein
VRSLLGSPAYPEYPAILNWLGAFDVMEDFGESGGPGPKGTAVALDSHLRAGLSGESTGLIGSVPNNHRYPVARLGPAIHVFLKRARAKTWMSGTRGFS